jgi:solute carrier family 25 carnitine/acylcarnitine transporter 20/29
MSPVEHLRIRMQIQGKKKIYNGSLDAGIKIFKKHGIAGVQKGWVATVVRDVGFFGLYFTFYEIIARALQGGEGDVIDPFNGFIAGGLTGIISWVSVFPTDSLKSISQTEDFENRKYKNYRHMVKTVIKEQGMKKLYNGLPVCTLRAFPVNAITFAFYELAKKQILTGVYSK